MTLLIVRLGALGDVVHTIPAAAALRRAFPSAQIHWLVEAKHRSIVDLVTSIDRVIALEGPPFAAWRSAIPALRDMAYDAALDFQGLLKSAALTRLSGASRTIGFSTRGLREKTARPFYSDVVDCEGGHVVRKNLRLLRAVGVSAPDDEPIAFPLADVSSIALKALRDELPSDRGFALINAGAAWPNKRWPVERFGEVASYLRKACGLSPVVLWGPGEASLADAVVAASSGTARVAPPTTIVDLVALCRAAALVVSGDTGPLHIATAVGAPSVSIFGPTDPMRNGPLNPLDVVVSGYASCRCHYERRCHETRWCLGDASAGDVCRSIERRLSPRGAGV